MDYAEQDGKLRSPNKYKYNIYSEESISGIANVEGGFAIDMLDNIGREIGMFDKEILGRSDEKNDMSVWITSTGRFVSMFGVLPFQADIMHAANIINDLENGRK